MSDQLDIFLRDYLAPTGIHVCMITPDEPDPKRAVSGRSFSADWQGASEWIKAENAKGRNAHWSANLVLPGLNSKPKKSDIVGVRVAHVDIDPPKGDPTWSKDAAFSALAGSNPTPSVIISSGSGLQALYWLTETTDIATIEQINRGVSSKLGGDRGTWNADRLLRFPGTMNYPDKKKQALGRVPTMAGLVQPFNGASYAPAALLTAFPAAPYDISGVEELPDGPCEGYSGPAGDEDLIRLMLSSRGGLGAMSGNKASVADLWKGDPETLAKFYPSDSDVFQRSDADLALCAFLAFWTGRDSSRMERLFRQSGLMRDKWSARPDYRAMTIGKALSGSGAFYNVVKTAPALLPELPGVCAAGVKLEQWEVEEVRSDQGKLVSNSHNVAVRFLTDTRLVETLALDEMAGDIMLTRALPGMHENEAPRRLIDADIVQVQTFLQSSGFPRIGKDAVYDGMVKAARKRAFHPVRAWLNGVVWDGVPRVETWLSAYLRADDTMYTRGVGRSWLIATVARIFAPGCKADSLMVLEGAQGCGKSTAAHILGGEWFSDSLPDVRYGDKDLSQHLAGKWIIEIAELAATSKAEDAALKSFISRRVEKYRRPYERKESEEPRQCVFIGTTNRSDYLRDETGARRFWPVRVGGIDLIALRRDRDQLFAEALDMFRRGVPHYPDAALSALIDAEGRERTIAGDPWDDILADYVKDKTSVTVKMLLEGPLQITASNMSTGQRNRALGSLRRLGWQKGPRQAHGQPYVPPPVLSPEQLAQIS